MSELHFVSYDPDAMWQAMMDAYEAAGGDTLFPGDEKSMLLRVVQSILVSAYAAVDTAALNRTLRCAVSEYLDLIGETRGIIRNAGTAATATASVSVTGSGNVLVPKGTLFTLQGTTFYETTQAVVCAYGAASISVPVMCTETGTKGNAKVAAQMTPVVSSAAIGNATLITDAIGGRDAEDDESYRERIREGLTAATTTGTATGYRSRAMAVNTGILDASAVRGSDASVDVTLLFAADVSSEEKTKIIADVNAALNADDARPISDDVDIAEATTVTYALKLKYTLPSESTTDVLSALTQAASDWTEWQNNTLGQPFDPYRLMAALYTAGATRVEFDTSACTYAGGTNIAYTAIDKTKRHNGAVTLEVMA